MLLPDAQKDFYAFPVTPNACAGRLMPAGIRLLKSSHNPLRPAPIYSTTVLPRAVFAQPGTPSITDTVFDDQNLWQSWGRR
jgi:hypothetical protein